jgi:hypothetical protein
MSCVTTTHAALGAGRGATIELMRSLIGAPDRPQSLYSRSQTAPRSSAMEPYRSPQQPAISVFKPDLVPGRQFPLGPG